MGAGTAEPGSRVHECREASRRCPASRNGVHSSMPPGVPARCQGQATSTTRRQAGSPLCSVRCALPGVNSQVLSLVELGYWAMLKKQGRSNQAPRADTKRAVNPGMASGSRSSGGPRRASGTITSAPPATIAAIHAANGGRVIRHNFFHSRFRPSTLPAFCVRFGAPPPDHAHGSSATASGPTITRASARRARTHIQHKDTREGGLDGAPGGSRTPDILRVKQALWPTELRARKRKATGRDFADKLTRWRPRAVPCGCARRPTRRAAARRRVRR
jgi:hypothetical protein